MKKKKILVLLIVILIAFVYEFLTDNHTEENITPTDTETAQVHFIDVGQGDSELILLPDGKTMLIDAGENGKGETVVNYLEELGVEKIDFLVGTHPHSDHIGGLDVVIENFQIGEIYMPRISGNTKTYEDVLEAISSKELKIKSAEKGKIIYESEDSLIEILGPVEIDEGNLNNCSAIVKLTYKDKSFLFTGDAEKETEEKLENVKADVLKVGHHGSSTSSSERFIKKVSPEYAVMSLGEDNDYGHPHKEVRQLFEKFNIKTYRTDECGTVIVKTDGEKITVETEK